METVVVPGKTTLVEYFSDHCSACSKTRPFLESVASSRGDLAVRLLNIDRPGMTEIDFESPLAYQAGLHSVPYYEIYDSNGKKTLAGEAAREQVKEWYSQGQMMQRGQNDPGTRSIMEQYEKK